MFFSEHFITTLILVTLIGGYLIDSLAEYLNIRHLNPNLPHEFSDVYDTDKYARSQEYLKVNTRFGFITASFDLTILLIFWFGGGFGVLDTFVRGLGQNTIVTGLVFIGILLLLKLLISLPFSLYSTFVIEEKFGFNRTTPGLFFKDLVTSILLSLILGGFLLSLILWFFESFGPLAWILCWMASILFIIGIQYLVPTWIMPLFNKFIPLEQGTLKDAIFRYARSIDFSLSHIFVMDGSKRSGKANAFFTGFGKNKRIVLFDTLIKQQSVEELVSVIAHEMGHFKKKHILRRLMVSILQMGVIFFLISLFISQEGLFHAFFVDNISIYAGLVFFGMLFSPIDLFLSLIMQFYSRRDEYEADRFAAITTGSPHHLVTALKQLSVHNLANLTPHPFYVFLNYSHPPILERIGVLKKMGTSVKGLIP
ncbi:endopeptidase family protein [Desulforapulum autotrophicum HRM2]|uniref:Endopeptidase family protein n=1 Tax=Desulforapulum autotrophicum (strain ATCC 43914 / DSM 3382 / VKM B-1955 / HRM2) TaxID=177437 RepID=C0QA70_DESAH|nr:M48 family metallopeptidase [Desulforapulum autotrophicum]ACN14655.1 endopeptidase family protein [Desulforapulum autotrophicum HRM2]